MVYKEIGPGPELSSAFDNESLRIATERFEDFFIFRGIWQTIQAFWLLTPTRRFAGC